MRSVFKLIRKLVREAQKYVYNPRRLAYELSIYRDWWETSKCIQKGKCSLLSIDSGDEAIIVSFTNMPFLAKAHAVLAKALQSRGYRPVIITSSRNKWGHRYSKLFGIQDLVFWDMFRRRFSLTEEQEQFIDNFLDRNPGPQEFKRLEYHGVRIGRLALSTAIRRARRGRFDFRDLQTVENLRLLLKESIRDIHAAEEFFRKRKVSKLIVRDSGYLPNGAIYEVGLNFGIDAVRLEHALKMGKWMVKRYSLLSRDQALFSLSPETWEKLKNIPLTNQQERELDRDFRERYAPDGSADLYRYQKGKRFFSRNEIYSILGLDPRKKTAVIFSHISWDANFFDGEDLFDDFEHWLVETVRIACENPALNWVVKLHPANVYKLRREGKEFLEEPELTALRQLEPLPDHIRVMRSNTPINTWSLFFAIDYGLTVRGTIGMELPCFGIPVVTAGTGRYSGYGFTIDPSTKEEYRQVLLYLQDIPRLSEEQVRLARRHAYWVFLRRLVSFDEIGEMTTMVDRDPNHPLHHNFVLRKGFPDTLNRAEHFQRFLDWLEQGGPDFLD